MSFFCIECGSVLIPQSSFSLDEYDFNFIGEVLVLSCSNEDNCKAVYEICDIFDKYETYSDTDIYKYRTIKYTLD